MPVAVYILGMSIFALGTTEFLVSGLLPQIAADLGVSIPDAGLLVSGFAIGMIVGAPVMAVATLRLPRKLTLLGALALFVAGQVLGALAPSYGVLMAARVVTAVATGAFWAVGAVVATRLVAPGSRARALAVLVGGLTVANVIGVPLGTLIGERMGWRVAFWAIAALAVLAFAGVVALVPRTQGAVTRPDLRAEVRAFAGPRIWVALATTAVTSAAIFGTFSYVAPMFTEVTGLSSGTVPVLLTLFGLGSLLGITVGGRIADRGPLRMLYVGLTALAVVLVALSLLADTVIPVGVLIVLFGVFAFAVNPALNVRVFGLAGDAPTLANSAQVSAFNTGNTIGPWLGGLVISGGLGYAAVPMLGAVLAVAAVGVALVAGVLERRHTTRSPAVGHPVAVGATVGDQAS